MTAPEPAGPVIGLAEGPCPLCAGGTEGGLWPCDVCGDSGLIRYPEWTPEADAELRRRIEAGSSERSVAIGMKRPVSAVYQRIAVLNIKSPRPEPSGSIRLLEDDGREISVGDPARDPRWLR